MIISLLFILTVVTAIRIRLLDVPLERDEGEYAYAGQLLLQGVSPYQAAYNVTLKLPGTCVAYALIMAVFGQTAAALHAGVILISLASAGLIFVLARRICGDAAGVVAAGTYALLSIVPETVGLAAHATHFVMLPVLAGVVLLQNLDDHTPTPRIFFAGLLIGLAVLMKQSGAAFGLFAAVWVVRCGLASGQSRRRRLATRLVWLALGGLLPLVLTCLMLVMRGEFGRFWLWTFQYAGAHGAIFTLGHGIKWMFENIARQFMAAPGLWSATILGLILLFGDGSLHCWRHFIVGFSTFSFLAVCPGWYFRGHYFIQLLPAAGLLAAVAFHVVSGFLARRAFSVPMALPFLVFAVAGVSVLIQWNDIYFRLTPGQVSRAIYGTSPFPEAVEIGRYLASHTAPDARIAVIGSEPEIYFYSRRRSATGYICTYPLVEPQPYVAAMQKEMIQEVEKSRPDYVVYVNVHTSWVQSTAPISNAIFDWFDRYQREQLRLVGLVEIQPAGPTEYRWFDQSETNVQTSAESWLAIFKRRADNANPERN
ncbi:MAG: ArnT family glycosyltransferase [Limisphaerales bacterium]